MSPPTQTTRKEGHTARQDALAIWNAGVDSVCPSRLMECEVRLNGHELEICDHLFSREDFDRVLIIGAGKATAAITEALVDVVKNWLPIEGWINVPDGTQRPIPGVHVHVGRPAKVNEPTKEGVFGSEKILRCVSDANDRDLCIAVISGGGSALLPLPREGITLEDKLAVIRKLSESGANISELNTVRKHLSRIKGGGLLRACRAKFLLTLVLSDVLGDPIDLIASGPTVLDSSTPQDSLDVLKRFDPEATLPKSIYRCLNNRRDAPSHETTESSVCVIGNLAIAVDEAGIEAERRGYNHLMHTSGSSEGEAEAVGRYHAENLVQMLRSKDEHKMNCLITGGEPVVTLVSSESRGLGGRNQQLALAAYQRLLDLELTDEEWGRIAFLSAGTDGEDGPTDAAGAVVDDDVRRIAIENELNADTFLKRNDAYHFFAQTGGLIKTGPTETNVCDLRVAVIQKTN